MADLSADDRTTLAAIVGADHVLTGDAVNEDDTHDECLTVDPVQPLAVLRPADADQVAAIVAWAREQGVPVTARGSGTGLSGACTPREDGGAVSFARMAAILEIATANQFGKRQCLTDAPTMLARRSFRSDQSGNHRIDPPFAFRSLQ